MSKSKPTPGTWYVPSYAPYQVRSTEKREEREIVVVDCRQPNPPICYTQEEAANASVIAAAVNAAKKINPHDPLRAAELLLQAFEALKQIANWEFTDSIYLADTVAQARKLARQIFLDATSREERDE